MPKIKVTSRPETFRRAGLLFTRKPREIEVDAKTLKTLAGEANLTVIVLPDKAKEAAPKKPAKSAKSKAKAAPAAKSTAPEPTTGEPEKVQGDS